jgi:hypothetical protein
MFSLSRKNAFSPARARVVAVDVYGSVAGGESRQVYVFELNTSAAQLGDLGIDVGHIERELRERNVGCTAGIEEAEHARRTLLAQTAGAFFCGFETQFLGVPAARGRGLGPGGGSRLVRRSTDIIP